MRHTAKLTLSNRFYFILIPLFLLGCSSPSKMSNHGKKVIAEYSKQKVFYYPYDLVWRAAQLALKYPIAVNNMDNGYLETEYIKAIEGFSPPNSNPVTSTGIQYKVTLTLVKGKVEGKEGVRVTVNKSIERKRDFFTEPENLNSDGLEEKTIIYRIERELIVDEAIKKAQAKGI